MPNEKPILFSGQMVRDILEGRKTQTRRVLKYQPTKSISHLAECVSVDGGAHKFFCPYGAKGDRLWVRESAKLRSINRARSGYVDGFDLAYMADDGLIAYPGRDDYKPFHFINATPSIHMPRWASRITLEIVSVRSERLQDITEEDALAEGIYGIEMSASAPLRSVTRYVAPGVVMTNMYGDKDDAAPAHNSARAAFECLWDSINAKRGYGWDVNPWVWVIEFRKL